MKVRGGGEQGRDGEGRDGEGRDGEGDGKVRFDETDELLILSSKR